MNITITENSDGRIDAAISGEVDADNCAEVGATLLGSGVPATTMKVDASQLTFLDSSGISELLRVNDAVNEAGGTFLLVDPTDNVRRVLEITGLLETFGID